MAAGLSNGIGRLRRPEYTGENRCIPCTVVNVLIAFVVADAVVVAGVWLDAPVTGALAGLGVFALSMTSIYLRGYLVPGTPWLTKTYFPDWALRHFDKHSATGGVEADVDVEATLLRAGVVDDCERGDDLCLEDDFRTAWRERVVAFREDDVVLDEFAAALDVDPERLTSAELGGSFVVNLDDRRAGRWESEAAFLAEVAADRELRERLDEWSDLQIQERSAVLSGLRIFLERCPACDGPAAMGEEVVESCCGSSSVVAVTCADCDARLFETRAPSGTA